MDIKELDSFRLSDAVKFHNELNPKLFRGNRLDPAIRKQLLVIADDFLSELGVNDLKVKDITVSGSNAAYSYTPHSDLDLHILIDYNQFPNDSIYRELFKAKKDLYNDSHNITVKGIPVELYAQDSSEPFVSLGQYSVKDDKWLKIPTKRRANFDQSATVAKYRKLHEFVLQALQEKNLNKVKKSIDKLKQYRKAGLSSGGEFSPENLAYKALRKQGAIQKLFDLRDNLHSKSLSIENMYQNIGESTNRPIVYFDMDGVLADFNGGYQKLFGKPPSDSAKDDPNVSKLVGSDFFSTLKKLPGADELINIAVKLFGSYSICSSPLRNDHKNSELNKRYWIAKHLNPQPDNIVITGKKDSYAKGKNILIDDKPKNIIPWRERGGIGILYNAYTDDPNSVIEQLKQIAGVVDEDIPVTPGPTQKQRAASIEKTQPKLGSGYFGKVYDQPEGELGIGTAKKISRFDQNKPTLDGYYAYINKLMSLKDQNDNPYLPQIYNANIVKPKRGAPYFELDMEKLSPWKDLEEDELLTIFSRALDVQLNSVEEFRQLVGRKGVPYKDIIIEELLRYITKTISDQNYKDIKGNSIKDSQLIEAINIIRYLQKTGYGEDLHAGNVMVRRTKYGPQLVLTDPLSFGSQTKMDKVEQGKIRINTIGVTVPPDYFVYVYDKFSNNALKIHKMYGTYDEIKKEVRQKYDPYWYDVEIIANDRKLGTKAQQPKSKKVATGNDWIPSISTTKNQARNKQHSPKRYNVYDQPHDAPPWITKKMLGDVIASSENEALRLARQKFQNVPPHKISVMIDILSDFDKKLDEADDRSIEAKEIDKKLKAAGYKKLGAGVEAAVYIRDQGSVIKILMPALEDMKDLNKDFYNAEKTFLSFYNFVKKNKGNPFLPKFIPIQGKDYARFKIGDRTFLQISMEQLYPYKKNSLEEAIIWAFSEFAASKMSWSEVEDIMGNPETFEYFGDNPQQYYFMAKHTAPKKFAKAWQTIAMTDKNKLLYYQLLYETMATLYKYGRANNMGWDLHTENVMRRKDGTLVITDPFYDFINNKLNEIKALEDYDPNGPPPGPEFKPTMPAGTLRVDVSDVYDWYKLGQHISNMKGLGKHDFGKGPPSTILSFGDEDTEHQYIQDLEKTGLTTTDIDPIDKNQPIGMKKQKVDPTYNVGVTEGLSWSSLDAGLSMEDKMAIFEEYAINGNLTEAIDDDKRDYFMSLFRLSDIPIKDKKYIVAPLALVGNKIMPLDDPSIMNYFGQDKDGLVFYRDDVTKTYPSKAIRDLSVFNVFTFANKAVYDKFRTALSLKFDINLPSVGNSEQGLTEALDKPYKLKWYPGDWDEVTAYADIPDGDDLTIIFNNDENEEGEEAWSLEFYRNNSQEITGEGDAQRIFATVLSAIQTFIKKYKPNRIIFSASKEVEPGQKIQSRANLYDRLVQRYAKALGYKAFRADAGNKVHYELSKIKKSVSEASGYIPSEKEKNDPRFKTALTVDVKPDSIKKNAKAFGSKISRAGIPPLLKP